MNPATPERVQKAFQKLTEDDQAWLKMYYGNDEPWHDAVRAIRVAANAPKYLSSVFGGSADFWRERLLIATTEQTLPPIAAPAERVRIPKDFRDLCERGAKAMELAGTHSYADGRGVVHPYGPSEMARRIRDLDPAIGTHSSVASLCLYLTHRNVERLSKTLRPKVERVVNAAELVAHDLEERLRREYDPTPEERVPDVLHTFDLKSEPITGSNDVVTTLTLSSEPVASDA
jgi:hypothetical protein